MDLFSIDDKIANTFGTKNYGEYQTSISEPKEEENYFEKFKNLVEQTIENRFETTTTTIVEDSENDNFIPSEYLVKINNFFKEKSDNIKPLSEKSPFEKVVNFWLKKGFKMAGAVALATICKFESGFNPKGIEKSEKAGKGYGVSKNNTVNQKGYGVGLYAWTGGEHKEKALRAGGYDPSKVLIEDLNFDQQLELAYNEFSKLKPDTFRLIKNTNDIKEALNIAYAYMSAGSKNSKTAPSDAECEKLAHKYQLTHAKLGYKKAAKTNTYEQRLKWAIEKFNELT